MGGKNYGNEQRRAGPVAPEKKPSNYQEVMDAKEEMDKQRQENAAPRVMKSGGKVSKYARGGGIESRGKTKGRMV